MKSGEEKRSSVTVLQGVPEEIPSLKIQVDVDPDEMVICSRTTSTIRPDSPLDGSATPISPKSMISQNSSVSNLERLKVPWDVRSLNSVKDFNDLAPTNDYSMDEELGVGGFGTVYKGTSKSDGKEVAIKIIKRERLHSEENFQEELKVARKLAHPNIVRLHASYQDSVMSHKS